ncbi:hypothetical protein DM01DRAFT_114509 [Hesseltinella vesiculosa]|uniref:Uncharacterized protein n=1 Tax=Hesseltinella vesiculosa TaxID=101127 RepID=A0A1X2GWD7_9FUNG|nr:hypothetical protein DM01DRAFT_114509 [Hesseltinella vesiculosa]
MRVHEEEILDYYFRSDDYHQELASPRTSMMSSSSTSSSTKKGRRSSFRQSLMLSSLFFTTKRQSASLRFSLPAFTLSSASSSTASMTLYDEPLSPKQLEIEQLISDYPERTVRVSVTPDFAV